MGSRFWCDRHVSACGESPSLEKFESRIMGSLLQKSEILNINT